MRRALVVWGTSSNAGKSLLVTALCRWAARQGIDVAPFKAQNMSNNARVVPGLDGAFGEIGAAQYFQARAAGVTPSVDMNPVLLKPERDTASQVVVQGRVSRSLSSLPWRERSERLAVFARESFLRLRARHDLVVVEGAGSPAEINLAAHDYVNLDTARWAAETGSVTSLLVTDIDRGGAFAHLYGTWALLPDAMKATLAGFVLNKFRGDAALLAPGPARLETMTGVPVVAVLPMWREHGLPDEDGVFDTADRGGQGPRVAIVAYPRASNLDEFQPLRQAAGVRLSWVREPAGLAGVDWIVLPGSKQVSGDLRWLRETGLAPAIERHAVAGGRVLGVCGGLQMLGARIDDADGVDGEAGTFEGLDLLPLTTCYDEVKRVRPVTVRFTAVVAPWSTLASVEAEAYEIRNGRTTGLPGNATAAAGAMPVLHDGEGRVVGWQRGPVLGLCTHGLFESAAFMRALFGLDTRTLERTFDGLADWIDRHFDAAALRRWTDGASR